MKRGRHVLAVCATLTLHTSLSGILMSPLCGEALGFHLPTIVRCIREIILQHVGGIWLLGVGLFTGEDPLAL